MREADINRIKRVLEGRDSELLLKTTELNIANKRLAEIEAELEMKSGENNRLRRSCTDMEQAMKDLYKSRKGQGSLYIELDSLKDDNERLLKLLKNTVEYADMEDN